MFMRVKKNDNMADLVVMLRKKGKNDYESGRYSSKTIKYMEFSIVTLEAENEAILAGQLREIWDKAWAVQATKGEIIALALTYILLIFVCLESPLFSVIKTSATQIMNG
jgi:hypothetical protein